MSEIGGAMGLEFTPYVGDLCPYLLEIVENNNNSREKANIMLIQNTLKCICSIVPCLAGHLHVILAPVLAILDSTRMDMGVRREAVDTLILIARNHNISDRAAAIMQTWMRCIREKSLQEKLMELLIIVMDQVT